MCHSYGVVLRKLDLLKEAVEVFVEAIHALPLHWGAWLELSNLVTNIEMVTLNWNQSTQQPLGFKVLRRNGKQTTLFFLYPTTAKKLTLEALLSVCVPS